MDNKQESLYVKACVIAANEEDSHGDKLSSEDIKKIFTSFNNKSNFEIFHQNQQVEGISLLENYINQNPELIGDKTAQTGSWVVIMKIDNPTIQEAIFNHEFEGVSLSSTVKSSCNLDLPPVTTYSEITDKECVLPVFISLVGKVGADDGPANGYPLVVMDYENYIKKSVNGGIKLDMKEFLQSLKDLVNKAETEEPVKDEAEEVTADVAEEEEKTNGKSTIKKEEETVKDEAVTEEVDTNKTDKIKELEDKIKALEDNVKSLDEKVKALEDNAKPADKEEETTDNKKDVKPKITKCKKTTIIEQSQPQSKTVFEMMGRDEFGRKINRNY